MSDGVKRSLVAVSVVVGSAVSWWLAGFWASGYAGPGRAEGFDPVLPAQVGYTVALVQGGLVGGAVLGALARTPPRAAAALVTALTTAVLLTWQGPWASAAVHGTGTDPRLGGIMAVLLAVVSVAGAGVGVSAWRGPARASLLVFLAAAAAVVPLLMRLGADIVVAEVAAAVLVAVAVAIAVGRARPLWSVVVVVVGVLGYVVVRALLVGLVNALNMVQVGLSPDAPGQWREILDYGLAVARSYPGTGSPGYPRLGVAVAVGILAGALWRVACNRRPARTQPGS